MRKLQISNYEDASVDLTPMLDIVFIMLIFFIVAATFSREQGIDVSGPGPSSTHPPDIAPVAVTLGADCWARMAGRRVDTGQISANVQQALAEHPGRGGTLTVEGDVSTACMAGVMDQMRQGGLSGAIALRSRPDASQGF